MAATPIKNGRVLEHCTQEPTGKCSDHSQRRVGDGEAKEIEEAVNSKKASFVAATTTEIGDGDWDQWIDAGS